MGNHSASGQGEWGLPSDWSERLGSALTGPEWTSLRDFVDSQRAQHEVYPPPDQVLAAFRLTSYEDTRAVILRQDPYHGPGQAQGLCFSVPTDSPKRPLSLVNILKELKDDVGIELPNSDLEGWARQGVLLLNTTLTVRDGQAGSHRGHGWERFTDRVLHAVDEKDQRVVFILWGSARRKKKLITNPKHEVIESPHPSPLSACRGFFGTKPFSRANEYLIEADLPPIDWTSG